MGRGGVGGLGSGGGGIGGMRSARWGSLGYVERACRQLVVKRRFGGGSMQGRFGLAFAGENLWVFYRQ